MDSTESNETEPKEGIKSSPSTASTLVATSKTDAQAQTPPKRAQRQRNPVVLLQHSYYAMYDDKNNRAGNPNKRKRGNSSSKDSSSLSPPQASSKHGNSGNTKKRKNSTASSDRKSSKALSSSPQTSTSSKTSVKSKSVYRWVGPPISSPGVGASKAGKDQSKNKYYHQVELNVGDHPALIKVGDFVLVSSSDYEEDQLHDKAPEEGTSELKLSHAVVNTASRSAAVRGMMNAEDDDDEDDADDADEVLNSTLEAEDKMDIAMNSLDPYIGRVEEMWEEPKSAQQEGGKGQSFARMKYRVRWFFKVKFL